MKRIITSLILALSSQAAFAGFTSGDDLNTWADSYVRVMENSTGTKEDNFNATQYIGYIRGVMDAYEIALCLPKSVTPGQGAAITRRYVKDHPERWNESGAILVLSALQSAFPCAKPLAKSKPQS